MKLIILIGPRLSGKTAWATDHIAESKGKWYKLSYTSLIKMISGNNIPVKEDEDIYRSVLFPLLVNCCANEIDLILDGFPQDYDLIEDVISYSNHTKIKMFSGDITEITKRNNLISRNNQLESYYISKDIISWRKFTNSAEFVDLVSDDALSIEYQDDEKMKRIMV